MTDPSTAVAATPLVEALQPYVVAIVGALITAAGGILFAALKGVGVAVADAYQKQIEQACANEAGKLIAAAADNLAAKSITVGSPGIAAAANAIVAASSPVLAKAVTATGLTPERAASIILGQLGKLQAQMTSAPPAAKP